MLGLEDDALAVALEALDGGLVARLGLYQRDHDVVALGAVLPAHQHQVAVTDVRADHAVTADAEREEVLAPPRQRVRRDRELALAILLREQRLSGRDATEDGNADDARPPAGGFAERQRAGGAARGGPPLQHALALQRLEMVERRARRHAELPTDLAHRRRRAVARREGANEVQHVALPRGQLSHPLTSLDGRHCTQPVLSTSRE